EKPRKPLRDAGRTPESRETERDEEVRTALRAYTSSVTASPSHLPLKGKAKGKRLPLEGKLSPQGD
ncbi:MAG: hypothetical protein II387_06045, partial [Oscillospiraceae bacterium]|nr:hypothetical protein [Oscillospiraceae bacterium]